MRASSPPEPEFSYPPLEQPKREGVPLSVALASHHPSRETDGVLRELASQLTRVGGELVIATSDAQAIPSDLAASHCVRAVVSAEQSVFSLRAAAIAAASGAVVAVTEDHCMPMSGWTSWLIAVHATNPQSAMIVGPIINGSRTTAIDRANFLATFAEFMPPLTARSFRRLPPIVNISYKRAVLPRRTPRPGWLEFELNRSLARKGNVAVADGPPVAHVQSRSVLDTLASHFHNGRSTGGLRDSVGRRRLPLELARRALLPFRLTRQILQAITEKNPVPGVSPADLALVFLLACCHAAGEAIGIVRGEGRSAELLE